MIMDSLVYVNSLGCIYPASYPPDLPNPSKVRLGHVYGYAPNPQDMSQFGITQSFNSMGSIR